jgi:aromatic ring-opening dioxygenase catalytic subunit (LigB family)
MFAAAGFRQWNESLTDEIVVKVKSDMPAMGLDYGSWIN